jgi:hypothetical protein
VRELASSAWECLPATLLGIAHQLRQEHTMNTHVSGAAIAKAAS